MEGYGANCIYVTDSAGYMLPDDVTARIGAVRAALKPETELGFHGHHNLAMGVANSHRRDRGRRQPHRRRGRGPGRRRRQHADGGVRRGVRPHGHRDRRRPVQDPGRRRGPGGADDGPPDPHRPRRADAGLRRRLLLLPAVRQARREEVRRAARATSWSSWAAAAWSAARKAAAADAPPRLRPNIVFVLLDDAGFSDLGSYGGEIATPTMDALAAQGVRFSNFHTAPTCEASRAMLHSGVDNHRAGMGALMPVIAESQKGKPGYEGHLSDRVHSLGTLMRDGGYATYSRRQMEPGLRPASAAPARAAGTATSTLEQTGADNFEAKVWAPFNTEAVWWQDGQRFPPAQEDFYIQPRSIRTRCLLLRRRGALGGWGSPSWRCCRCRRCTRRCRRRKPTSSVMRKRYQAGWDRIRAERYQRQVQRELMPAGLTLPRVPASLGFPHLRADADWSRLGADEQRQNGAAHGRLRRHARQRRPADRPAARAPAPHRRARPHRVRHHVGQRRRLHRRVAG